MGVTSRGAVATGGVAGFIAAWLLLLALGRLPVVREDAALGIVIAIACAFAAVFALPFAIIIAWKSSYRRLGLFCSAACVGAVLGVWALFVIASR